MFMKVYPVQNYCCIVGFKQFLVLYWCISTNLHCIYLTSISLNNYSHCNLQWSRNGKTIWFWTDIMILKIHCQPNTIIPTTQYVSSKGAASQIIWFWSDYLLPVKYLVSENPVPAGQYGTGQYLGPCLRYALGCCQYFIQ